VIVTIPLVPESLFGRLFAALLVTVGGTFIIVATLLVREWSEILWGSPATEDVATRIAYVVRGLATLPPEQSEAMVRERGEVFAGVPPLPTLSDDLQDPVDAARRLEQQLERILGPAYALDVVQTARSAYVPPAVHVVVTLPSGLAVTFQTPVPVAPPKAPQALLLQLLVVTLILGSVLYWTARTITRPLRDLETAAEVVGRGARFAPLRESGARELRSATRAFNAMQERLYRYLDSRSRVLAAMSHDLRTPLTRLKLRMEALDDERLRERCNSDLDEMERLVTGALRLFKGVDHEEPLEIVCVDDFLGALSRELTEIGWDVSVSGNTSAPINARKDSLRRCLINLISNAVKYGRSATVTIADEGREVVVRVQDEGPGIPEAMLEKVFEPFFRIDDSRNVDTGGIGLGLSIARDVAQAHGGSLVLRNRSPRGLEAILRLPRPEAR
jgi:signal transduction histidine kinase